MAATGEDPQLMLPGTDLMPQPAPACLSVDVGAVEIQAAAARAPTPSTIFPTSGVRGTAAPVTLTGTNLTGATAINVSGTGSRSPHISADAAGTQVSATFRC